MAVPADMLRQFLLQSNGSEGSNEPLIFHNMIGNWPASSWRPDNLQRLFGDTKLNFRIGKIDHPAVQLEGQCAYVEATIHQFAAWLSTEICSSDNPLSEYPRDEYWCYADYKYMAQFADKDKILKAVDWSMFGFAGRDGRQSTLWLGSVGAYTVCHYDTYGCNLVAQIHGRKRWVLFPPAQTEYLYPTRIPFEESSVFSLVNIQSPDLGQHPLFQQVAPFVVTLEPGDVMFVPRHWWHYVECLDAATISINSWIELPLDHEERLREAVARTVALGLMDHSSADYADWLNPTEESTDHTQNMAYLNSVLRVLRNSDPRICSYSNSIPNIGETSPMAPGNSATVVSLSDVCKQFDVKRVKRCSFDEFQEICCRPLVADGCTCETKAAAGSVHCSIAPALEPCDQCNDHILHTSDLVNAILHPTVLDLIVDRLKKTLPSC